MDLPAWRAALSFASGAAAGEGLLARYWALDPVSVPVGAILGWRWLAAAVSLVLAVAVAVAGRGVCTGVPFPGYAASLVCRHERADQARLLLAAVVGVGLSLSLAQGARLLGNPLRLAPSQAGTSQSVTDSESFRVLVTGISRASGDICFVQARAWMMGVQRGMAVRRAEVELVVPLSLVGRSPQGLLLPGSVFQCRARPYLPEPALNPYEYDSRTALARDGIVARLRVETLETAGPGPAPTSGPGREARGDGVWLYRLRYAPVRVAAACRWRLEDLFERYLSPAGSALARALVLGDRGRLDANQVLAFERSGSLHLMAVSGLHVAFLAGVIGLVCGAAKVSGRVRNAAVAAGTGLFALITGAGPAVLRATVMLNAGLWRPAARRGSPLNSLGLAALLILAANPLQIADAGFQLSFAATLGIVAWAQRAAPTAAGRIRAALLSSYGAQVSSLPVLLHHFYRFAPWAPLNNLLLLPLGSLVISALFAVSCIGLVLPAAFAVLAWPVDRLLRLLAAAAATLSRLPGSLIVVGRPSPFAVLGAWILVVHVGLSAMPGCAVRGRIRGWAAALQCSRSWPDWLALRVAATSAAVVLLCMQAVWVHRPGPELTVSFFAVGQGDAALVRCGRQAVLVDFGAPAAPGGAGASRFSRSVLPYLQATRTFPALAVLSHPHADHIGGLADAMRQFPGMRVLTRDCFEDAVVAWLGPDEHPGLAVRVVLLESEEILTLPATARGGGASLVLELFWAPGIGSGAHVNELSCAMRVSRRDAADVRPGQPGVPIVVGAAGAAGAAGAPAAPAVLFAGDLGNEAEAALVAGRAKLLPGTVLKVGHHGSGGSTSERFLREVSPALAVVSVGQNGFGHPSRDCLDRLAQAGAAVLRTDVSGWIYVRMMSGGKVRVETFR